jgi:hypothetical protein
MNKITTKVVSRTAVAATLCLGMAVGAVGIAAASPLSHDRGSHSGPGWNQSQHKVEGIVSSYVAGSSISILVGGATTPTTFNLTSTTTVTGLATGATLAVGARVNLVLSSTSPSTVSSINVEVPKPVRIEAVVSTYTAGSSITVLVNGSTTPTTFILTSATTVSGLATGVTLASPTNVDLVLSSTTPGSVTSIFVEANGEGSGLGYGKGGSKTSGTGHGNAHRHGLHSFRSGGNRH